MKKLSVPFVCIIIIIATVGAIYTMIQTGIIQQNVLYRTLWIIFAGASAVYGLILWYEAGEYFLVADFGEGFKKLLWGMVLIMLLAYPMAATMVPAIQIVGTWKKPIFLKVPEQPTAKIAPKPLEPEEEIKVEAVPKIPVEEAKTPEESRKPPGMN